MGENGLFCQNIRKNCVYFQLFLLKCLVCVEKSYTFASAFENETLLLSAEEKSSLKDLR